MSSQYSIAVIAACPFPYTRGTPIRILRMAESLAERGHHVEVVTYHLGQKMTDLPFDVHRTANLPTYHKLSPGPTYQKLLVLDTLLALKIFTVLRSGQFDVIHAHHYEGLIASLPAARAFKIPVVFDVHTLLSSELPHYSMGLPAAWLRWIGNKFDQVLPPQAAHIVAVTNAIREKMIHEIGIPENKITTVYTGLEAGHFNKTSFGHIPESQRTLIYTGTLETYQRVDLMLTAFRKVLDRQPDVRLKIVSDSSIEPYQGLIREMRLGKNLDVIRADYFSLPEVLHSAMIALSPRVICDGLPVKILNYMATGRAIVSFAGSAEIITDQDTGLIVKDYDVEGFAAAVLRLLDDPRLAHEIGQRAQVHVEEFFVWETAVKRLEDIYQNVLRKRPA